VANSADSKKRRDDLILAVVGKFVPAFAPGATVLYRRDRSEKQTGLDAAAFGGLGISDIKPDRIPDVIVHHAAKNHLILIDTVPGHGPINAKRHDELTRSFTEARPYLILITAFLNRSEAAKYLSEISWATEVWVADAESHLIHFNGERFLGPYDVAK
jgi:adenine-specific DNA-methyltransferase